VFEFLPHTADIRMRVEAASLQELFQVALDGMNEVIFPPENRASIFTNHHYHVHLQAADVTALLIDFLSDVLTAGYERKAVFFSMEVSQLTETEIDAMLFGEEVGYYLEDIKAVTYHEANVHRNINGNWETMVIFDI
jgi:SHS2 domain-containing protein